MSSRIRILVTGGTFDKDYDELNGRLFFKDSHIAEMLRLGRSRVDVTIRTVMMLDSLEMTDADRALIVAELRAKPGRPHRHHPRHRHHDRHRRRHRRRRLRTKRSSSQAR